MLCTLSRSVALTGSPSGLNSFWPNDVQLLERPQVPRSKIAPRSTKKPSARCPAKTLLPGRQL